MDGRDVFIVRTGTANLASVQAALARLGATVRFTEDPSEVIRADRIVLPGVGSFEAAMIGLSLRGLDDALRYRIERRHPTLAICLGMQLLFRESDESPGLPGLGIIDAPVSEFGPGLRVPQIGWNEVQVGAGCGTLSPGCFYFANSYRVERLPPDWNAATAVHGRPFVAAIESGPVVACQFHPELSGEAGRALLQRWWEGAARDREVFSC